MEFFTRLLGLRRKDEEGGGGGDEGERSSGINSQHHNHGEKFPCLLFVLGFSIYRAVKGLLRKVGSIFYQPKPPHPLLPLHNPATTHPLLLPTPTISSASDDDDDDRVLWFQEKCYPAETDHHIACASTSDEMEHAAFLVEESTLRRNRRRRNRRRRKRSEECNMVVEERWIKHYSSRHRILLVGEGNFSFSACLAKAFRCASNIVATSLDSQAFLKKNYGNAESNILEIRSRGGRVIHGIDATQIANHQLLPHTTYDRIVFNFPFAGFFPELPAKSQLRRHRRLVSLFLKNAKEMISENGEIHITHKTNGKFHPQFHVESIASSHGLRLIEAVGFERSDYPGYNTKYGFGGDDNFNCVPSKTFKFSLKTMLDMLFPTSYGAKKKNPSKRCRIEVMR